MMFLYLMFCMHDFSTQVLQHEKYALSREEIEVFISIDKFINDCGIKKSYCFADLLSDPHIVYIYDYDDYKTRFDEDFLNFIESDDGRYFSISQMRVFGYEMKVNQIGTDRAHVTIFRKGLSAAAENLSPEEWRYSYHLCTLVKSGKVWKIDEDLCGLLDN